MKIVKEELENTIAVEGNEEVKTPELCAVPKQFAINKLNALYKEHQAIFDEHNMWINILNSQVNVVNQEEAI